MTEPRLTVTFNDDEIVLAWHKQTGHIEGLAMDEDAAQNLADLLYRAVRDLRAHRKLVAEIDGIA